MKSLTPDSKENRKCCWSILFCGLLILTFAFSSLSVANESEGVYTLKQTIEIALKANLALKSFREEAKAASALKDSRRTEFFPTFSANYQYVRHDEERRQLGVGVTRPDDEYSFSASVTQPLFTGFSILNRYKLAELGLDAAKIKEKLLRQDIILKAKETYFLLLQSEKLFKIAQETVTQINAQKEVAKNFYQVGMTPLNDLLQSQVELANAKQELIVAKNVFDNAESDFNLMLRKPIDAPVKVDDILEYTSFKRDLSYCISEAEKKRLEVMIARLDVDKALKEITLARKDYYPTLSLQGTYYRQGEEWSVDGGDGILAPDGWDISAMASWNFWEWGRTTYGIREKLSRLSQAQLNETDIIERIRLEVKKAFLRTQEAEKAILTVAQAIEQAKENFRINEERYKEQVATSTDVLDAQTLLSKTMTNYYSALYGFKRAKASLYRAMGQEVME